MQISELDRQLIEVTQDGLPLVTQPYDAIGEQLGISGEQVRQRLQEMLQTGLIRRIGAVPNHYRLGFTANGMSVWDIADDQVEAVGQAMSAIEGVSHCYQRPRCTPMWPYNLFAMVHGKNHDDVEAQVEVLKEIAGTAYRNHDVLYSTSILKKTGFRLKGQ